MIGQLNRVAEKAYLVDNVLFLNGITRAGKFLLGKVISVLERVEHFQYVSILEHLPFLVRLGFIEEEAAIASMRVNVDEHAYNMAIGRNLNFRFTDASSLYNAPDFDGYLSRSLSADIQLLLEKFKNSKRLPCFIIHESLQDIPLFYKAFPAIKIIDLNRHPVDLISSWFRRGWGHRHGEDPLSFAPVFDGVKGALPWYATSWKEEYEAMSDADRVIKSVATLIEMGNKAYEKLSAIEKQKILRITYEELVENTPAVVEKMSSFLDMPAKESLPIVMKREKIPRKISLESRREKLLELEQTASKDKIELLYDLSKRYEAEFF